MTAADRVDGVVDAFIAVVNSNLTLLGIGGIEERAEDPAVLDKVRTNGAWMYIIPLAEGRDRMDNMQGGTKDLYHNFSMNVTAYYDETALTQSTGGLVTPLRAVRRHGYNLIDLFDGNDNQLDEGFVYRFELEQGYYEIIDRIIYTFNVKFYCKILEV